MHEHEHKHEHHCCPHKKKKLICLALGVFVAMMAIVAATCGIPCKEPAHVAVPDAGKVCAFPDAAEKPVVDLTVAIETPAPIHDAASDGGDAACTHHESKPTPPVCFTQTSDVKAFCGVARPLCCS